MIQAGSTVYHRLLLIDWLYIRQRAFMRARYEMTEQTPESVAQWYAASHRLLALCQRLVDEGIEPERGS